MKNCKEKKKHLDREIFINWNNMIHMLVEIIILPWFDIPMVGRTLLRASGRFVD